MPKTSRPTLSAISISASRWRRRSDGVSVAPVVGSDIAAAKLSMPICIVLSLAGCVLTLFTRLKFYRRLIGTLSTVLIRCAERRAVTDRFRLKYPRRRKGSGDLHGLQSRRFGLSRTEWWVRLPHASANSFRRRTKRLHSIDLRKSTRVVWWNVLYVSLRRCRAAEALKQIERRPYALSATGIGLRAHRLERVSHYSNLLPQLRFGTSSQLATREACSRV